jgi:uncharacterized protein YaaW (UPF0174 family)
VDLAQGPPGQLFRWTPVTVVGARGGGDLNTYGFNFETLYYLDIKVLYDIVQIIRGENVHIAFDYDVIIRGSIIPFLRDTVKTSPTASKDEIMRSALAFVAKRLKVDIKDWDNTHTDDIAWATRRKVLSLLAEQLEKLDSERKAKVLAVAKNNLAESAKTMGVPLAGAGVVVAGELSGFGIYLATTTGLHALSLALGTTFSWGVYQGATTLLGIVLGPIGWAIAGAGIVTGITISAMNWMQNKRDRKLMLVGVALLLAIGESPFRFFGTPHNATFDDVRQVYRSMMKTLHPDRLEKNLPQWLYDDFNEKLLRCQEMYEKLQRTMQAYDRGDEGNE